MTTKTDFQRPAECDSTTLCDAAGQCVGRYGTQATCAAPQPAQPADLAGFPVVLDERIPPGEARIAQDGETVGRIVGIAQPAAQAVAPEHWSDCATNNAPAYPPGPCDCMPTYAMCRAAVIYANGPDVYAKVPAEALAIEESIYAEVWKAMSAAAPAVAPPAVQPLTPLTMDQVWDAVREADIDWHTGWAGDPMDVNRYLQLVRIVERAHRIGKDGGADRG